MVYYEANGWPLKMVTSGTTYVHIGFPSVLTEEYVRDVLFHVEEYNSAQSYIKYNIWAKTSANRREIYFYNEYIAQGQFNRESFTYRWLAIGVG